VLEYGPVLHGQTSCISFAVHYCSLDPRRKLFTNRSARKDNQYKNEDDIRSYSLRVKRTGFENYSVCKKHKRKKKYPYDKLHGYQFEKFPVRFLPRYEYSHKSDIEYLSAKILPD
jgi:hypothetical protein